MVQPATVPGRRMSRHMAKKQIQGRELFNELESQGVSIQTRSIADLAEEAPLAYKDIHQVIEVVDQENLAKKVARLKPVMVVKG